MDGTMTGIAITIVILCTVVGYAVGKATAAEECGAFGAFANGSDAYKCEERK